MTDADHWLCAGNHHREPQQEQDLTAEGGTVTAQGVPMAAIRAAAQYGASEPERRRLRIPPNLFGIALDPVLAPFLPVAVIVPLILAAALAAHAYQAGRVLVVIFLALTAIACGWLLGQRVASSCPPQRPVTAPRPTLLPPPQHG
jgi:hypothetical protein